MWPTAQCGHQFILATSSYWLPLNYGQPPIVVTSSKLPPLYCGHPFIVATSSIWPPAIVATGSCWLPVHWPHYTGSILSCNPLFDPQIFGPFVKLGTLILFTMSSLIIVSVISLQLFCCIKDLTQFRTFPYVRTPEVYYIHKVCQSCINSLVHSTKIHDEAVNSV